MFNFPLNNLLSLSNQEKKISSHKIINSIYNIVFKHFTYVREIIYMFT